MKKISFMFTMLLTVLMSSLVITSCSSDEEEEKKESVQQIFLTCPDNNHPHMIDLGLPSGTKWACCNIGASSPEKAGGYYAWGETEEKEYYIETNYKFFLGDDIDGDGMIDRNFNTIDIDSNIAGTRNDVSTKKWGTQWQIPTDEQIWELWVRCTRKKTKINEVDCIEFYGSNGGRICIPLVGMKEKYQLINDGFGFYWTSINAKGIINGISATFGSETYLMVAPGEKASSGLQVRAIGSLVAN